VARSANSVILTIVFVNRNNFGEAVLCPLACCARVSAPLRPRQCPSAPLVTSRPVMLLFITVSNVAFAPSRCGACVAGYFRFLSTAARVRVPLSRNWPVTVLRRRPTLYDSIICLSLFPQTRLQPYTSIYPRHNIRPHRWRKMRMIVTNDPSSGCLSVGQNRELC